MRESSTRFSVSHINLSNVVNLLISTLIFHFLHIVLLGLRILSPLVALLSPGSCLKIAIGSRYHPVPVVWNCPADLRRIAHYVIPSPILNSPVYDLSTSINLNKLQILLFSTALFLLISMYSPRLSQDWYHSFVASSLLISQLFTLISSMQILSYPDFVARCIIGLVVPQVRGILNSKSFTAWRNSASNKITLIYFVQLLTC